MIEYKPKAFDMNKTKTFDARNRKNLVTIDSLYSASDTYVPLDSPEMDILVEKIKQAVTNKRPVILFYGAHVIKCGLSKYLIELIKRGFITHIASNGAGSIHDFELAYLGGTSEYVPTAIEDGSFGLWEQTGKWMNDAIKAGAESGMGYGEALAHMVDEHKDIFPYRDYCVFYNAFLNHIPATFHVTIGTDIIHEHPSADFSAIGKTSGTDFCYFIESLKELEGGVYLNVGSAITGAEVFLKALSVVRNNGYKTEKITTANFDIIPMEDYKSDVPKTDYLYYYRPRKNIINRPVSRGGTGLYIYGNHLSTIPTLFHRLIDD